MRISEKYSPLKKQSENRSVKHNSILKEEVEILSARNDNLWKSLYTSVVLVKIEDKYYAFDESLRDPCYIEVLDKDENWLKKVDDYIENYHLDCRNDWFIFGILFPDTTIWN